MYDPHRDPQRTFSGAGIGIMAAFIPRGAVGIFAGAFILLLVLVAGGVAQGPWLVAAVIAMVALVPLIARAIRSEMRREDQSPRAAGNEGSLPEDSQLSDEERRDAMRQYRSDSDSHR